ncbi:DUF2490 domain-containing protein [Vibrio sp. SCSIO 43136]|uniref:outer membrane protein n=1 Tax=Vibrio sp. SCSIO 43136 TaxID=2819101 RepID=UPI002074D492|nr:DUF2490 domain-containing protein [Vibrio sp. SCSIO 43136]USD63951.1 hypothetical protein J4N39_07370 [Vibrio sp. SCSIO 43136]
MTKTLSAVGIIAALFSTSSNAGDFELSVGGFLSKANTELGVSSIAPIQDIKLDFESDLELEESELLPYLQLAYRFNDKHAIYADWRRLHRRSTISALSEGFSFEWEGQTYEAQVGGRITSTLNIDLARLGYGYKFFNDETWDIEIVGGIHLMQIEVGFEGAVGARVDGSTTIQDIGNPVFQDVTAPLPNFGLLGSYSINEDWDIDAHSQFFYLEYQDISGLLIDASIGVSYQFTDNLSASAAYSYYEIGIDYGGASGDLDVNFQFYGPMATLNYQF